MQVWVVVGPDRGPAYGIDLRMGNSGLAMISLRFMFKLHGYSDHLKAKYIK